MGQLKYYLPVLVLMITSCTGCDLIGTNNGSNDSEELDLQLLWEFSYELPGDAPRAKPLIIDNKWIISSGDTNVSNIDIETGELIWKSPLNHFGSLRNRGFGFSGNILAGSLPDKILGWNVITGDLIWTVHIESPLTFFQLGEIQYSANHFIASGNRGEIYFISENGESVDTLYSNYRVYQTTPASEHLYAAQRAPEEKNHTGVISSISLNDGMVNWQFKPSGFGSFIRVPPILEDGILYCGTIGGIYNPKQGFFALDAQTGEEIWRQEGIFTYSAVLAGDRIFGVNGQRVWALDKHTGEQLWITRGQGGHSESNLDYMDGHVYWAHGGGLHVFDAASGELLHVEPSPDGSFFWLVTSGEGRIFAQSNRHLYAFAPWGYEEALE